MYIYIYIYKMYKHVYMYAYHHLPIHMQKQCWSGNLNPLTVYHSCLCYW